MKVKEIGFVAIPVNDVERSRKFYEGVLGLQKSGEFMDGQWIEYAIGKDTLAIAKTDSDWKPSDQGSSPALEVESFEGAIEKLKTAKVPFAAEPFETPVCHIAVVQDPDGNKLMIHKLKST
ncbi:MAG TPA: VOC family protein [Chthoniobacterales bacterium]|nr:VOC family protein [Chthoniobacterales bacterium]